MFNAHRRKEMLPLSDTTAAYLAGLFDGEGCVGILFKKNKGNKAACFKLQCSVTSTDKSILEWAKETTGLGCLYERKKIPKRRVTYQWLFCGFGAEQILRVLLPHSRIKREQIELALEFRTLMQRRPFEKIAQQNWSRMGNIRNNISQLNGGGRGIFKKHDLKSPYVEV